MRRESYKGSCFCGAVQFELSGEPIVSGYCHCDSCRRWSGAPLTAFTIWEPGAFRIKAGQESILSYSKTELTARKWCGKCGGHIYCDHETLNLIDVMPDCLQGFAFTPAIHIHYQETVLPFRDGLPKYKDFPAEAGGSGETMPE